MAATDADTADKARVSGNELYKAGQLAQGRVLQFARVNASDALAS